MPARSKDGTCRAVPVAGRNRRTVSIATTPAAIKTTKTARQPAAPIRRPPSAGPRAVPTADIDPRIPMARPALPSGAVSRASATVSAIIAAAPAPCAARAATRTGRVGAAAQTTEAREKSAIPPPRTRRWPKRSPSCPAPTTSVVTLRR